MLLEDQSYFSSFTLESFVPSEKGQASQLITLDAQRVLTCVFKIHESHFVPASVFRPTEGFTAKSSFFGTFSKSHHLKLDDLLLN